MILDTDLRRRRLRHRVPITFVTSEPYIGHLGLGGVGDSKGLMESQFRQHDIKWITNAKIAQATAGQMRVQELDDDGKPRRNHELPFAYGMVIPAFRGVDAVAAVLGLCNPRGFVLVDAQQRSKRYRNVFSAGVCIAIPPVEATPVPTGAPKLARYPSLATVTCADGTSRIRPQYADVRMACSGVRPAVCPACTHIHTHTSRRRAPRRPAGFRSRRLGSTR